MKVREGEDFTFCLWIFYQNNLKKLSRVSCIRGESVSVLNSWFSQICSGCLRGCPHYWEMYTKMFRSHRKVALKWFKQRILWKPLLGSSWTPWYRVPDFGVSEGAVFGEEAFACATTKLVTLTASELLEEERRETDTEKCDTQRRGCCDGATSQGYQGFQANIRNYPRKTQSRQSFTPSSLNL